MKMIVTPARSIMLMGPTFAENVDTSRPSLVPATAFIQGHVATGNLLILKSDIAVKATDAEWAAHYAECMKAPEDDEDFDKEVALELALESFAEMFPLKEKPEVKPPKGKGGKGKKAESSSPPPPPPPAAQ